LIEPALERFGRGGVAAFERFEQGDGRGKRQIRGAPVQWKTPGGEPLPEREGKTQNGEHGKNKIENIHVKLVEFVMVAKSSKTSSESKS
jgi:hypothetical protein